MPRKTLVEQLAAFRKAGDTTMPKNPKGQREPALLVDDAERKTLVEQLAAFRKAYLDEFRDDGGDDFTMLTFVVGALHRIRDEEKRAALAARAPRQSTKRAPAVKRRGAKKKAAKKKAR